MDFTKTDVTILLTMSLAIISMSFVFPALGLTNSDAAAENDIPEFDIDSDRFDFVGDFPQAPRTPTEGTLEFDSSLSAEGSDNRVWLDGDTDGGYELFLAEGPDDSGEVRINEWKDGDVVGNDSNTFNESGRTFVLIQGDYGVRIDSDIHDPPEYEVSYTVTDRPGEGGGIIGSVIGAVGDTAQVLAWFGTVLWWVSVSIIETTVNVIAITVSVMTFGIDLVSFLFSEYTSVISSASNFASVFVAIPGILLSAVLAKLVFIGIGLLPTT